MNSHSAPTVIAFLLRALERLTRGAENAMFRIAGFLVVSFGTVFFSTAASPDSGNLLISTGGSLYEYTVDGELVQSGSIPYPGGTPGGARDVVVTPSGKILVYNGTFDPYLSELSAQIWTHRTHSGWSTVNNISYGGIAATDQYAFVTDMRTFGDSGADEAQGIVRFDLSTSTSTRFATGIEPIDLNIGLDGLLYALYPGGSDVYDPETLSLTRTIDLNGDHRSIAVNASGELFLANWNGVLQKLDPDGNLLLETNLPGSGLDVDVSSEGLVVVGIRSGDVVTTDEQFLLPTSFNVGNDVFVTVPPIQTPPLTALFVDLTLENVDSPDPAATGNDVTYTITVTNNGTLRATGVTVTDSLPVDVSLVSATPSQGNCSGTRTVICNLGNLESGANTTVTIVAIPETPGMVSNTASVVANETDENTADNSVTIMTTVATVFNAAEYFPLQSGNQWTYQINGNPTLTEIDTVLDGTVLVNGVATKAVQDSDGAIEYYTNVPNGVQLHREFAPPTDFGDGILRSATLTYSPPSQFAATQMRIGDIVSGNGIATFVISGLGSFPLNYASTSTLEIEEHVSVPLGNFLAERIRVTIRLTGSIRGQPFDETVSDRIWFAKHVGPVKIEGANTAELTAVSIDSDGDGRNVTDDNCPAVANPAQLDMDGDGMGDLCDLDIDGDGQTNGGDPDDDNDGMSDAFETANGLDPTNPADASGDLDGDGFTNLQESNAGTDPNDPASNPATAILPILQFLLEE